MAIKKRHRVANYIKINGKYEVMGVGFEGLNETFSPIITSTRYICDKSKSQSISGYEWSSDFEAKQIINNKVVDYILDIAKYLKVGADAESEYLIIDLDKEAKDGGYNARKINVAIAVDSFSDTDGEMGFSGSLKGIGDMEEGTATIDDTTREVTYAKGFEAKTV